MEAPAKANKASHCRSEDPRHLDDPYYHYQIRTLIDEFKYVQTLQNSPLWRFCERRQVQFIALHIQQFYWTVSRLFGSQHRNKIQTGAAQRPILDQEQVALPRSPRILIDVTPTARFGGKTGIQRVVREIAKAATESGEGIAVVIENGQILSYFRHPQLPNIISIQEGDQLLLLDGVWSLAEDYTPILQEFIRCGGRVISCIYDLIHLLYPGTVISGSPDLFYNWLQKSLPYVSAVVTISNSVAEDFIAYLQHSDLPYNQSLQVGAFPLGADIKELTDACASQHVRSLCQGTPFFITVGTLEARKNHKIALDAFEQLWKTNLDVRFIIVGKMGWMADATRDRILHHPEFRHRLIWLDRASDADLIHLYRHAKALIQPSIAEGFGLPIVEAAHHGTPVIASDIRIFREVGGSMISYFDPMDARSLVARIHDALNGLSIQPSIASVSWKDAAATLLKLVREESYPYRL